MTVLPLLVSAAEAIECWLPNLAEGHRFASLAEVYRLNAPRHSVLDVQWHAADDDDAACGRLPLKGIACVRWPPSASSPP